MNPILYVEIPVIDLARAILFYAHVFGFELEPTEIDGYQMAFLPYHEGGGATGALVVGDVYRPSHNGPIVYFRTESIDETLARATSRGAKILYAKKKVGDQSYVAEFEDSEGNRIALTEQVH